MQKIISIFVDESGDFGKYSKLCPYYIITMVFHNQQIDIKQELNNTAEKLANINLSGHVLHTGPLIRREEVYLSMDVNTRMKILMIFYSLFNKLDINYHTFIVPKTKGQNCFKLIGLLTQQINSFVIKNHDIFADNKIIVYYDNGQKQVNSILASVFNSLDCEFRRVKPENYRLFQIADLITTFELINYKRENLQNSESEKTFFGSLRNFNKNFYKKIIKKSIK